MKNTFTKSFFLFCFLVITFNSKSQSLTGISPNFALQGQSLTTTITATGNIFTPGSPFGGTDVRMIKSGGSYEIDSDWWSVVFNSPNDITASWSIPGGAPAGLYDLYVDATDGFGSWMTHQLNGAFQIGCPISLSQTHTNTTCGNTNGTIDLTVTGGTSPYSYVWSNGATTQDLNNLSQGIYSVTVTDQTPCSQSLTNIIIGNTNGPSVSETHLSSTCANANGSVNITVTGGTPPYNFSWSNSATTEDLSGIMAGTYLVTVTDFNSCAGYVSATVNDSNELSITLTSVPYNCSNQGAIAAIVNSGTAPYTYLWSNGSTNDSLINVPSGNYHVTVTDALGCQRTGSNQLFNSYNYYVYLNSVAPNCGANGSLTANAFGGIAPYSYLWSNGGTSQTISSLSNGSYSVTVTDVQGCTRGGNANLYSTSSNIVSGMVFYDNNGNCALDSSEIGLATCSVYAFNGSQYFYGSVNSSGYYSIHIPDTGTFTIHATFYSGGSCGALQPCGSSQVTFSGTCDTSANNNFGFTGSSGFDLALHPGWSSANPGFEKEMWILYFYNSAVPFTDTATIVFHYDPNLVYDSSWAPLPVHDAVAHTLTWQVSNFVYGCCGAAWPIRLRNWFHVPASLPINTILNYSYSIDPTVGDCNPSNNILSYTNLVTGSQDPNEKEVSPSGDLMQADSILTYTIHFQNTGNDTTNFIVVSDTLSPFLDPATVENLASSHNYSDFDISGTGILTWVFNPIFLVDSATNEPASKGFITFRVKLKPNVPFNSQVNNTASIYFDYNPAVITNTVSSTVINSVHSLSSENVSVLAYPNPFTESTTIAVSGLKDEFDFTLTNVLGKKLMEVKNISEKQFIINRTELPAGVYFFTISEKGKAAAFGKLIVE